MHYFAIDCKGGHAWIALVIGLLVWPVSGWAGKGDASTPEDRAKAVVMTRQLESDPLGEGAVEARQWLMPWLEQAEDITVTVCDILGPIPSEDHPYSAEILTQMIFSNAAFQIEHPEKADETLAVQTAGVEGALKAYEAIVKDKPGARIAFFDDLARKRDDGQLAIFMKKVVSGKCR